MMESHNSQSQQQQGSSGNVLGDLTSFASYSTLVNTFSHNLHDFMEDYVERMSGERLKEKERIISKLTQQLDEANKRATKAEAELKSLKQKYESPGPTSPVSSKPADIKPSLLTSKDDVSMTPSLIDSDSSQNALGDKARYKMLIDLESASESTDINMKLSSMLTEDEVEEENAMTSSLMDSNHSEFLLRDRTETKRPRIDSKSPNKRKKRQLQRCTLWMDQRLGPFLQTLERGSCQCSSRLSLQMEKGCS